MLKLALVVVGCVVDVLGSINVSKRDVDLNPAIPTNTEDAFVKFQQAVAEKQNELKTTVVFSDLESYKTAFNSFLNDPNGKLDLSIPEEVDSNFAKFQKFMVKYMRQYGNFDELKLRYGLFQNILKKSAGYNDGGDGLAGINYLADKTHKEKQGLYG